MTVRAKLFASLWALGVSIALLAAFGFWSMSTNEAALDTIIQDRVAPMRDLKIVADQYAVDIVDAAHKARNGNLSYAAAAEKVRQGSERLHESWKAYSLTKIDREEERLVQEAEARMRTADVRVDELEALLDNRDRAGLDRFVRARLYQSIDPVSQVIGKLVDLQLKVADQTGSDASTAARLSSYFMLALIFAAITVLAASTYLISVKVVAPLRRLAQALPALATQSEKGTMPHLDQQDEIGEIARAVDDYRRAVTEAEREKTRVVARVTEALATGLAALARGDLTSHIDDDFPDAYAKVRADFNKAALALHGTLSQVAQAAASIGSGTSDIWQASDDLSQRTEQQAASLEETAAAMTQITATVQSTAGHAVKANATARDAAEEAERSGEIVRRAVEAMGGIERGASEISDIISVIDGIAFQTNLLALNAGVEAARAGDAGRGFAVVASEVRALAQRSADAAKDVKTRITASSIQVGAGVALVGDAGRALERIVQKINEVSALVADIADAAEQQSTGLQQINTAVCEMDGVTQQNAAMVEEATAAARSLANEVDGMMRQIAGFRLHGTSSADAGSASAFQGRFVTAGIEPGGPLIPAAGGMVRPRATGKDGAVPKSAGRSQITRSPASGSTMTDDGAPATDPHRRAPTDLTASSRPTITRPGRRSRPASQRFRS